MIEDEVALTGRGGRIAYHHIELLLGMFAATTQIVEIDRRLSLSVGQDRERPLGGRRRIRDQP